MTDIHPGDKRGRVLIVAGSDSGGGAGIQADIKAVTALGGFAATAITALTAQNTKGVFGVQGVEPGFIRQQMLVVLEDIGADAIKTGMLHDVATIEAVTGVLEHLEQPIVADPVMVAQSGASLLEPEAVRALVRDLAPRASLITPNVPEADRLIGTEIADLEAQRHAAQALLTIGVPAALVKGGHLPGPDIHDVLASADGLEEYSDSRVRTDQTHGTGCTLASAIATGLAQGYDLAGAIRRARAYLRRALETAPGFGKGEGPVNHGWTVQPFDGAL